MFIKNFCRGVVLGLVFLALTLPAVSFKLKNHSESAALAGGVISVANTVSAEIKIEKDNRVETLKTYLESKNSPLAEFSDVFVEVADKYELDYRLLPAITGIESGFGRVQLDNSYNPFGWGGGYIYFESFEEAIRTVGFELYERCVKLGVDTPAEIGPSYCPPNYLRWIASVEGFIEEISKGGV